MEDLGGSVLISIAAPVVLDPDLDEELWERRQRVAWSMKGSRMESRCSTRACSAYVGLYWVVPGWV